METQTRAQWENMEKRKVATTKNDNLNVYWLKKRSKSQHNTSPSFSAIFTFWSIQLQK